MKSSNKLLNLGTVIIAFGISGCLTIIPYDVRLNSEGRWTNIVDSGIAEDAEMNFFNYVTKKKPTTYFTPDSTKVTWWARFREYTFPNSNAAGAFTVKWYDPEGSEFVEEHVTVGMIKTNFTKCSLPIKDTPVSLIEGTWKVVVYYQNQLIDQRVFTIQSRPASPNSSGVSPSNLRNQQPSMNTAESSFFVIQFQQAKKAYQEGDYAEAEKLLKVILEKEPYRSEAHLALSAVYLQQKNYEASLKEIDLVIQNPAFRQEGLEIRAQILKQKKQGASS